MPKIKQTRDKNYLSQSQNFISMKQILTETTENSIQDQINQIKLKQVQTKQNLKVGKSHLKINYKDYLSFWCQDSQIIKNHILKEQTIQKKQEQLQFQGTIDFSTHKPKEMITKLIKIKQQPQSICPIKQNTILQVQMQNGIFFIQKYEPQQKQNIKQKIKNKIFSTFALFESKINNVIYTGNFQNNNFHGFGKLKKIKDKQIQYQYEGFFKNGLKDGFGTQQDNINSQIYIGYFENNNRHGMGKLLSSNKQFQGQFVNGQFFNPCFQPPQILEVNPTIIFIRQKIQQLQKQQTKQAQQKLLKQINLKLNNLSQLNLKNNNIGDQGIKQLTSKNFSNLKLFNINKNNITLIGVSDIVKSKNIKPHTTIVLDSAKISNESYLTKVGNSLPLMKQLFNQSKETLNQKIDHFILDKNKDIMIAIDLITLLPLEGTPEQINQKSMKIQNKLKQQSSINPGSLPTMILALKHSLPQSSTLISQQSNTRSRLTIKIIMTGMQKIRLKIQQKIDKNIINFQNIQYNSQQFQNFENNYKTQYSQGYGQAQKDDFIIHKVCKTNNSIISSISSQNSLLLSDKILKNNNIKILSFFQKFMLSPSDFDDRGNYTFPENNQCQLQYRAGIYYFQPIFCHGFGIKVQNLYDKGNNAWLSMYQQKNQWAIAFHGINFPNKIIKDKLTILKSIFNGRQKGQMLKPGSRHLYQHEYCVNKPNKKVGVGIYLSPYFSTSLLQYTQQCKKGNETYRVLLQCRIKPDSIHMTSRQDYWVVNDPPNVRPYRVILVNQAQFDKIQKLGNSIYTESCDWNSIKTGYQNFQKIFS